jgi:hypothetical protein
VSDAQQWQEGQCYLCRVWTDCEGATVCQRCLSDTRKVDALVHAHAALLAERDALQGQLEALTKERNGLAEHVQRMSKPCGAPECEPYKELQRQLGDAVKLYEEQIDALAESYKQEVLNLRRELTETQARDHYARTLDPDLDVVEELRKAQQRIEELEQKAAKALLIRIEIEGESAERFERIAHLQQDLALQLDLSRDHFERAEQAEAERALLHVRLTALYTTLEQLPSMIEGHVPLVVMEGIEEFIEQALAKARPDRP